MPSTRPPRRRCACRSMSQPAARRAGEIGDGGLRAGQDDESRVARQRPSPGRRKTRSTPGSSRSGSKSSKLAILRQDRHGDHDLRAGLPPSLVRQAERVLGRQPMRVRRRTAPGRAPASRCARAIVRHAVGEQRRIAAEAVDDEAHDHRRIGRIDHRLRADEARDHAAAVDVADAARPARRRRARSPCWRCRWRAG